MLDFSHKAVHQFWHDYQDASIYRVISFMESVEDWTLDGHESIEAALKKLSETLYKRKQIIDTGSGNDDSGKGDDSSRWGSGAKVTFNIERNASNSAVQQV